MNSVLRAEHIAVCHTCKYRHPCANWQNFLDFCNRHQNHAISYFQRDDLAARGSDQLASWDTRKEIVSTYNPLDAWMLRKSVGELQGLDDYRPNADIKQAFQGAQTMTVTALQSLASSATAGWQSDAVDNTSNLYLDDFFFIVLSFANTAPANSKCAFFYAAHSIDGTVYTNPASGSQGTITLVDVTTTAQAMRVLGSLPYTTQNEVAESVAMSMAVTAGGLLPPKYSVAVINHSGAALNSSGNTVKHNGVFSTAI